MMRNITTFEQANAVLRQHWPTAGFTRNVYTLDTMRELMNFLGNPQDTLRIIHVAGTSGKTSTAYYAAALLHAAGKKVGLTVSPHVDEVNERVQINVVPLPEAEFCSEFSAFMTILDTSGIRPTYFELLTAFMYWEFARQRVDWAVVEVGLGGLLDATNVVTRPDKICVITDIGLDHVNILGRTIPEIAAQKAGIIQPGNEVFFYDQGAEATDVFMKRVHEQQAKAHIVSAQKTGGVVNSLPLFQQRNFGLSVSAVQSALGISLDDKIIAKAAGVYIPGRMDTRTVRGKTFIMDGAHNAQKLQTLTKSIRAKFPHQQIAVLVSLAAQREGRVELAVPELIDLASHLIITSFDSGQDFAHGSVAPQEIATACKELGFTNYEIITNSKKALHALLQRPEPILLATGSFYMLHQLRSYLE